MDLWTIIGGLALIIGIVASIVQVLDYLEKQRSEKARPVPVEVATPSPPAPAIPSNLPPWGEFIGREKEKARVREALASRCPLTCIGGIGKTADDFAAHWDEAGYSSWWLRGRYRTIAV